MKFHFPGHIFFSRFNTKKGFIRFKKEDGSYTYTIGAIFRVAALFGALQFYFFSLFFGTIISRLERTRIKQKKLKNVFFMPFFELKDKTAVFLKLAAAAAVIDLEQ
jgi:hypothetical protein